MKTLELVQGTREWDAHRLNHDNASDAPAMMGVSPYKTREQLLRELATGHMPEITPQQQALFDRGHAAEASIRPHIEASIGEELFPVVGVSDEHPRLSASFDGLTMDGRTNFEHKLWNEALANAVRAKDLPAANFWQCEQQMLVAGAERTIFVVSDGTPERMVWMEYRPVAGRAEALLAGWEQFRADLAAYVHEAPAALVVAEATESLPAVSVRMDGTIAVVSNLDLFGAKLKKFVAEIDTKPSTDQAFANCEDAVKTLKRAEEALDNAEAAALAQIDPVEAMRRAVADYRDLARNTRLLIERLVKARKEEIRVEILDKAKADLRKHLAALNENLADAPLPEPATFGAELLTAIKGKKTVDSVKASAAQALATAKIAATTLANQVGVNVRLIKEAGRPVLFPDLRPLAHGKMPEDLRNLIAARIAEADRAEAARLEAQTQRIREEERRKAESVAVAEPVATPKPVQPIAPSLADMGKERRPIKRPSDAEIVNTLAAHYGVSDETVIDWLSEMDLVDTN